MFLILKRLSKWRKNLTSLTSTFIISTILGVLTNSATSINIEFVKLRVRNYNNNEAPVSQNFCETPGCINAASTILKYMDANVDPCDNFYQFACGNFIKEASIPDDRSSVSSMSDLNDKLEDQIKRGLTEKVDDNYPQTFKLLHTFYNTCMDTAQIERTSESDFREILKSLGGWPVLDGKSWNESEFNWEQLMYKFHHAGYATSLFFTFGIGVDAKRNNKMVLEVDQASLGIPQKYLVKGLEDNVVQAYLKLMVDLAEIFGANREEAKKELVDSLNFEMELAKICIPAEKRRDILDQYNRMTMEDLQSKFPTIPWLKYINVILAPYVQVDKTEEVVVWASSYLAEFEKLVAKTPKRILANYAVWRAVRQSASAMNERVRNAQTEFTATVSGITVKAPRWEECTDIASGFLDILAGALYARRYFDEDAKAAAAEVTHDIIRSFGDLLKQVNWMDESTKKAALDKLYEMVPLIAYPSELMDNNKIDEYYQNLKLYPNSYLKSKLSANLFYKSKSFQMFRRPVNKTDWLTHSSVAEVNAGYSPLENIIQFPAGILQGIFFTKDRPKYLNYGGIGFVMGHEVTHGFDDEGSQFDKDGNLKDWWDPETKRKYLERAQCIVDQYSNYEVKQAGIKLNGINTQGENIADNGGLKVAYNAYNDWEKRNGAPEPRLPGLHNYTSQQLFWISAANLWCEKTRTQALKSSVVMDVHSPGEFRVIGSMSNLAEFSKDFNCPLGSPMNPVKKCVVW